MIHYSKYISTKTNFCGCEIKTDFHNDYHKIFDLVHRSDNLLFSSTFRKINIWLNVKR